MLDQLVLQTTNPLTLNITAVDPDEILVVKSISGLTSGGVTPYTGDFAREGGYYQGRRAKNLTPTITLKLNPDYKNEISVSAIREILYRTFYDPQLESDAIPILLKDDELADRILYGYTEDINTEQFSKEQTAMVSMVCTDPYLKSAAETSAADAAGWLSLPIAYDGSAATGMEMTIKVKTATNTVTVNLNGKILQLVVPGTYAVNDIIVINTTGGSRKITLNGVDVMAHMTAPSVWLQLDRSANLIKTSGAVDGDGKAALMSYKFRSSWWGI